MDGKRVVTFAFATEGLSAEASQEVISIAFPHTRHP
jgi:hypothetical protein